MAEVSLSTTQSSNVTGLAVRLSTMSRVTGATRDVQNPFLTMAYTTVSPVRKAEGDKISSDCTGSLYHVTIPVFSLMSGSKEVRLKIPCPFISPHFSNV